jgi:3-deoxy-7-phosphoheptulonate synthase
MIIELKSDLSKEKIAELAEIAKAFHMHDGNKSVLISSSGMKDVPAQIQDFAINSWAMPNDMQLASREYHPETREVKIGNVTIGGNTGNTIVITGPCSVESEAQITESAEMVVANGLTSLRGGCYKPRTSPYSFQGMGLDGLKLLAKMRDKYGLSVVTEVRDATHVQDVIEYSDVVQVGAKAMYDQGILRACAKTDKTVLIKRGFGTTVQECVQAAEFVLSGGNTNVVLCERGLRTFETNTRFTLDLCGVAWFKEKTNLPVVLDPSHAMGYRYGVPDLTRACTAMGVDGLLIEVHPDPSVAKSDAAQQLDHKQFGDLLKSLPPVAEAVGRKIV